MMWCLQMTLVDLCATMSIITHLSLQRNMVSSLSLFISPCSWQLMRKFRCNLLLPFWKSSLPWTYSNLMGNLSLPVVYCSQFIWTGQVVPNLLVEWIRIMRNHSWNYMCSKMCKNKTLLKAHVHAVQISKCSKRVIWQVILFSELLFSVSCLMLFNIYMAISSFCSLTLREAIFWLWGHI